MCNFFIEAIDLGEECDFCEQQSRLKAVRVNDIVWHICKGCESDIFFSKELENEDE